MDKRKLLKGYAQGRRMARRLVKDTVAIAS
ncbi:MAG TPA: patatin family protein, partial [Alteromonas australica]|nr:patatin family protein [Alteromonas australica]